MSCRLGTNRTRVPSFPVIADGRKRKLGTFSGGMRQRFGIAQALIGDPAARHRRRADRRASIRRSAARFLGLLSEIGDDVVVVLSTHIVDDVADVCQGMAILVDGQVRSQGDPRGRCRRPAGTIWRKAVTREELEALRRDHRGARDALARGASRRARAERGSRRERLRAGPARSAATSTSTRGAARPAARA